jgi:hypothetical protein
MSYADDMLNSEQRSALKSCAENGHSWWTNKKGDEYCSCCGWPKDGVLESAGGYAKPKDTPQENDHE